MSTTYSITRQDEITVIRFDGEPTADSIIAAMDDAAGEAQTRRRLWVFRVGANLTSAELERIAAHGTRVWEEPSKSAVVVPGDLAYGLARIHEAHRSHAGHDNRVFRDEAEAMAWLREPIED